MSDVKSSAPMGGTELILANLQKTLPELCDKVQIIMSRPEQYELDESKPRILWLQDLPEDPASSILRDPSYRTKFNAIVFCSYWQQQQYNRVLGIPYKDGVVIRNGVPRLAPTLPKPKDKLKFLYTSTPHRGLAVLAAAAEALAKERQDWELHVYSSLNIYGWHEQDKQFEPLYEKLRANPCVVYHGSQPNDVVRQACLDSHVFVYPSVYQETSCMAIQEAMMAGCLTITTSLGALIETCGSWAWMMPYLETPEMLASYTYEYMKIALDRYDHPYTQSLLIGQTQYFQAFYTFESRVDAWATLLQNVIKEGPPVEKLVLGF